MPITRINPVSPRAQPVEEKEKSNFDKVMEALSLASTALSIPADIQKIRQYQSQIDLNEQQALTEAATRPQAIEQAKLKTQEVKAGIAGKEASTRLAEARTKEIGEKVIRDQKIRADKIDREVAQGLGSDVISFQSEKPSQKNINRILEGRIMQRALANGSGPATFIAQIGLIRGQAGDVGPALARELNASLDRQGLSEKMKGVVQRWFANQPITARESKILSGVVSDISDEARKTLSDLERGRAKVLSKKYNIEFDRALEAIDSRDFINAFSEESIKQIQGKETAPVTTGQIKGTMRDVAGQAAQVLGAGGEVLEEGVGEAVTGAGIAAKEALTPEPEPPPKTGKEAAQQLLEAADTGIKGLYEMIFGKDKKKPKGLGDVIKTDPRTGKTTVTKPGVR